MIRVAEDDDRGSEFVWIGSPGGPTHEDGVVTRTLTGYESVVIAIVDALDEVGIDPEERGGTLDDVVDADSLDRLFADKTSGMSRAGGTLTFRAWGATVVVTGEAVHVLPPASGGGSVSGRFER
ncbi:MAG: HalOD1 output domain-containing protein [Salinigranum sp.]